MTLQTIRPLLDMSLRIRAMENALLEAFKLGRVSGTVHTCVGQELCAAALHPHLRPGYDAFFATHRGHGHYLAYGGPEDALIAELMGREGALCSGQGGTQNLHFQRFFSSGIQGGAAGIGVGYAWARRHEGEDSIAVVQLGDGTLGEGSVYEAFTLAASWPSPVLFLVEWNGWAQSTDTSRTTPGDIVRRAEGFGISAVRTNDLDPLQLSEAFAKAVEQVRSTGEPFVMVVDTRRLLAHSKGDDDRAPWLVAEQWAADPIGRAVGADPELDELQNRYVDETLRLADSVHSRPALLPTNRELGNPLKMFEQSGFHLRVGGEETPTRVLDHLNAVLRNLLSDHSDVVLLGEDLADPYGGAFKVTKGLSSDFPDRVISTPIAEAGVMAAANGMALAGLHPVVEIMFGDFGTLIADQLINFSAKFGSMYGNKVHCPVTVRLVSGGGRGYGPTHSQCLERLFCGVPGLRVVALSARHDVGRLYGQAVVGDDGPVVLVENKQLYATRIPTRAPLGLKQASFGDTHTAYPALCFAPSDKVPPDVTIVTYGATTAIVEEAMAILTEEHELAFDYVVLSQLWPLGLEPVIESVKRTGRVVVVEEATAAYGFAAAVLAGIVDSGTPVRGHLVGARPQSIPAVRALEESVLPAAADVVRAVERLL